MIDSLKITPEDWSPKFECPVTRYRSIIEALKEHYSKQVDDSTKEERFKFRRFSEENDIRGWEAFFVPEENFYLDVLSQVRRDDVIFDVGAGDLRLDLLLAEQVKRVYAVEINPSIIGPALEIIDLDIPRNLFAICGNAFKMEIPDDVTLITCLMIHREHEFPKSWRKKDILYCKRGEEAPIFLERDCGRRKSA